MQSRKYNIPETGMAMCGWRSSMSAHSWFSAILIGSMAARTGYASENFLPALSPLLSDER